MSQQTEQVKENLQNSNQWMRILYMILFWFILYFSMMVIGAIIFVQVLFALVTGKENKNMRDFSADLIVFIKQTLSFLSYNDNRKPFPFAAWGDVEATAAEIVEADADQNGTIIDVSPEDKEK